MSEHYELTATCPVCRRVFTISVTTLGNRDDGPDRFEVEHISADRHEPHAFSSSTKGLSVAPTPPMPEIVI